MRCLTASWHLLQTPFCVFRKDHANVLTRTGSCERATGMLDLSHKNISSLHPAVFENMPRLT